MDARAAGVATIYQEFSLVPSLTVAENIYLGRYPRTPAGTIDWKTVRQGTQQVLEQLSLVIDPDAPVGTLSVAEQQLVEIAKAISLESSLLIMDEPTAALGLLETQHLMELIRRLTSQDKAIIYISHRLDEVFRDRRPCHHPQRRQVGEHCADLEAQDGGRGAHDDRFRHRAALSQAAQRPPGDLPEGREPEHRKRRPRCQLHACMSVKCSAWAGCSARDGARSPAPSTALDRLTSGTIAFDGHKTGFRSPKEAVAAGVGMLPENRKTDGCFFNFEGPKNITISRLKDVLQGPFLSLSKERKFGLTYLQRMNIPHTALDRSVQYLSGGNQQKVIVARWLFSKARLLIMDEPTQGIDIGAKLEVYNVINELTASRDQHHPDQLGFPRAAGDERPGGGGARWAHPGDHLRRAADRIPADRHGIRCR